MEFIENIINLYYSHSTWISIIIYIFSFIIIGGRFFFIFKYKYYNMRYIINKLIYNVIYSAAIVVIGELLYLIGLDVKIEYVHFNAAVFIMITVGIIIYGFLLCLMFHKILLPALQICKYIQSITFLELFLLANTQHLETWEWITGTLGIISIEMLIMLFEKKLESIQKENGKETDYPDSDLYPTRRKQLEKFVTVLKQQEQEPYAIMVSGEWGAGKSSFIQALEKELYNKSSFIWIYAGSEKTVPEIMSEISAKIVGILKKNNIFIENKNVIENYFLAFSDLMEDTALKPLKRFSSILMRSESVSDRDYLNRKLDDLENPIYLIIDDLDRCDTEYQEKMFKVIRESMELHKCKTIFLVDRNKFLDEKYDANYIEKYVSYTLDLCEVGYQEIMNYIIDDIFEDNFIQEMNMVLLKDRNLQQVREMIYGFPINLLEKLENELSEEVYSINNKKKNDINKIQGVEEIKSILLRIKTDITVSRKLKNYLKGIKRAIITLNDGIENSSKEFLNEDWLEAIIEVQFVKNFMPDIYNDIKMSRDIYEFSEKYQGHVIYVVFDLHYGFLIHNEKKEAILNYLIYKIDVIDFTKVKTIKENYLSELRNDKGIISNIDIYIKFAESYDDLYKILDIYKKQEFDDNVLQENFISKIFKLLSEQTNPFNANTKEFLDFSKQFVTCLMETELTDKEKILYVNEGDLVVRRTIANNAREFINILSILFNVTTVGNIWGASTVTSINEFYDVLKKIDKESKFMGPEDEINKLESIRTYYANLEKELKKEKYKDVGLDLEKIFSKIRISFKICKFWDNIEYMINDNEAERDKLSLKKNFILDSGHSSCDDVFYDVTNLVEELKKLKEFYSTKKINYESNYLLLLLSLSYRIVLQYEQNPTWFREKKNEINDLLKETADMACKLDKPRDYFDKDNITKIKIYTYKFNEYCSDAE